MQQSFAPPHGARCVYKTVPNRASGLLADRWMEPSLPSATRARLAAPWGTPQAAASPPMPREGIGALPDELLLQIFTYLEVPDLKSAQRTCRPWADLVTTAALPLKPLQIWNAWHREADTTQSFLQVHSPEIVAQWVAHGKRLVAPYLDATRDQTERLCRALILAQAAMRRDVALAERSRTVHWKVTRGVHFVNRVLRPLLTVDAPRLDPWCNLIATLNTAKWSARQGPGWQPSWSTMRDSASNLLAGLWALQAQVDVAHVPLDVDVAVGHRAVFILEVCKEHWLSGQSRWTADELSDYIGMDDDVGLPPAARVDMLADVMRVALPPDHPATFESEDLETVAAHLSEAEAAFLMALTRSAWGRAHLQSDAQPSFMDWAGILLPAAA